MVFSLDQETVLAKVLTYATDYNNRKWSYSYNWLEAKGYLVPVDVRNTSSWIKTYWQEYYFETNYPFDVKEWYLLEIDSVSYKITSFLG